jgi:hypothetical protein
MQCIVIITNDADGLNLPILAGGRRWCALRKAFPYVRGGIVLSDKGSKLSDISQHKPLVAFPRVEVYETNNSR